MERVDEFLSKGEENGTPPPKKNPKPTKECRSLLVIWWEYAKTEKGGRIKVIWYGRACSFSRKMKNWRVERRVLSSGRLNQGVNGNTTECPGSVLKK